MVEIPGPVEVKRSKGKRKIKPEGIILIIFWWSTAVFFCIIIVLILHTATLDEEIETLIPASVTTKKKKKKGKDKDKPERPSSTYSFLGE